MDGQVSFLSDFNIKKEESPVLDSNIIIYEIVSGQVKEIKINCIVEEFVQY